MITSITFHTSNITIMYNKNDSSCYVDFSDTIASLNIKNCTLLYNNRLILQNNNNVIFDIEYNREHLTESDSYIQYKSICDKLVINCITLTSYPMAKNLVKYHYTSKDLYICIFEIDNDNILVIEDLDLDASNNMIYKLNNNIMCSFPYNIDNNMLNKGPLVISTDPKFIRSLYI